VLAISGDKASQSDILVKGNCFISRVQLSVLFDFGTTYSFVSPFLLRNTSCQLES